jgi:hypothetical protein
VQNQFQTFSKPASAPLALEKLECAASLQLVTEAQLLCCTVLHMQELDAAGLLATPVNPTPSPFTWQLLGKLH